jgi:hypothetical protein
MRLPEFTAEASLGKLREAYFLASGADTFDRRGGTGYGVTMALFCDIPGGWHYCEIGGKLVCTPPGVPCPPIHHGGCPPDCFHFCLEGHCRCLCL